MPEPITTLGLAKTTSDIIKNALDFAREQKNTDLAEKLVDLYRDFVVLMETNQELRNEVQQLKSALNLRAAMTFKAPLYYQEGDRTPYCPSCFENNNRAIHLVCYDMGKGERWFCKVCQQEFYTTSAIK
jgi:hypothetical protein